MKMYWGFTPPIRGLCDTPLVPFFFFFYKAARIAKPKQVSLKLTYSDAIMNLLTFVFCLPLRCSCMAHIVIAKLK